VRKKSRDEENTDDVGGDGMKAGKVVVESAQDSEDVRMLTVRV
jgi:hypothetical protein